MDGEPQFWETFKEDDEGILEALPPLFSGGIQLEAAQSLEELLDQGDALLQEFRAGNAELLERLASAEMLRGLVNYATRPEGDDPERTRYRSHTAFELLSSCDGKDEAKLRMLQLFEEPSLMELLWGFLLEEPVDPQMPRWNVLAGYFCGVAMAVLHHLPVQVLEHLRGRDAVQRFLRFLGTRCVAELFVAVLATEVNEPLLPVPGLLPFLSQHFTGGDGDESLALVMKTLLTQACAGGSLAPLLQQLPLCAATLMDKVITLQSPAAAAVLSNAVLRCSQLSPHPLLPMRGPNLLKPLEEETFEQAQPSQVVEDAGRALVESLYPDLPRFCSSILGDEVEAPHPPCDALKEATKMVLEVKEDECDQAFLEKLSGLSPEVEDLLEGVAQATRSTLLAKLRRARAAAEDKRRVCKSSEVVVEALVLLIELVRTQDSQLLQIFCDVSLLPRAMQLLFRSGAAVARTTASALCVELVRGCQNASIQAVCRFLDEGHLDQMALPLSTGEDKPRIELGLLRKVAAELRETAALQPEVQARLDELPSWTEVVLPELDSFAQLEQEPLGGFAKLDVPRVPVVNVDDVEFTPEDLRDIDEDSETEFLLDLGARQVQRQARAAQAGADVQAPVEGEWV